MSGWGSEDIGGKPPKLPDPVVYVIVALLVAVFIASLFARCS